MLYGMTSPRYLLAQSLEQVRVALTGDLTKATPYITLISQVPDLNQRTRQDGSGVPIPEGTAHEHRPDSNA